MEYNNLAEKEVVERTIKSLNLKNIETFVVKSGGEALSKIKDLIPFGVSVMNGSSKTLEQIGFIEYLKSGKHGWNNLHEAILAGKDPEKQSILRKQSVLSDFYLGSVHALAENGEFVFGSNSGSQIPHIVFTSPNLVFVVSTKKIVPNLAEAMRRLENYVTPLEDKRMKSEGASGTALNKILVFKGENPFLGRKIYMVLVEEDLGF